MRALQIFENAEFGKIRTVVLDGEPWFVGKDVAAALGYTNSRKALADHVDEEDKNTVTIRDGITQCRKIGLKAWVGVLPPHPSR